MLKSRAGLVATAAAIGLLSLASLKGFPQIGQQPPKKAAPQRPKVVDPTPAPVQLKKKDFNHGRIEHKKQACNFCHLRKNNNTAPEFPGHAACNDCHEKDLDSEESQICALCHRLPVDVKGAMIAFRTQLKQFGPASFSHKTHMDPQKMPPATAAPQCSSCHHLVGKGMNESMPSHPECYTCHSHQAGEQQGSCGSCHTLRPNAEMRDRKKN